MGGGTAAPGERIEDVVERDGEGEEIAAVDAAVVELACEVTEQPWPVLTSWDRRYGHLDTSFDDLDRGSA